MNNYLIIKRITAISILLLSVTTAYAGLVLKGPNESEADQSSTGNFFDVILVNPPPDMGSSAINAFFVSLSFPAASGVTFTGVTTTTSNSYIFQGATGLDCSNT